MARYIAPNNKKLSLSERDKYSDQVIMSGVNESYPVAKGVFFLEYVEAATGTTVVIKDGHGNVIISGIDKWDQDHSPIRCDLGVEFVGNLKIAKGFFLAGVFSD
jgi:hypothetical protein